MHTNPSQKLMKPSEQPYPNQAVVQPYLGPSAMKTASRPPERWARLSGFAIAYVACARSIAYTSVKSLLLHGWSGEQVAYIRIIPEAITV